jgi:CYTH domain-containing protein
MVKAVQAGQVWRSDASGDNFLVTKVYAELFTQYAMLRPANVSAPNAETVRVKVSKTDTGMTLPGYTFTQASQDF